MFVKTAKTPGSPYHILFIAAFLAILQSCTTIKDYPANRPFVYQTNIELEGKYTTEEKKELISQLDQQLHDSVQVRRARKFLFWNTIRKPPVYDSQNVSKSLTFMGALLNSLGYYHDSIRVTDTVVVEGDKQMTTIDFKVIPGKQFKLDSVWYDMLDSVPYSPDIDTLQKVTIQTLGDRRIKKGDPFSKPLISSEIDRLTDVYRNNGYLRFSREQLIAVWDTIGRGVLDIGLSPLDIADQLEILRQRRENPTADVEIRLRPDPDTARLTRYYVGTVRVYPDYNTDTALFPPRFDTLTRHRYEFVSYRGLFKPRKLTRFIYLDRGDLYQQTNFLRTQNKFNSIGAWRLVTINQIPRPGQDTVDFEIKLIPAKKLTTGINFDVSINQGNLATQGSLLGLGLNFSLVNRNFGHAANQASTNARYGIELTSGLRSIQTQQFTVGHTIQFPRIVPRMRFIPSNWREDGRTFLSINAGSVDRIDFYNVLTLNAAWGYEFSWNKNLIGLRIPNVEYNLVKRRKSLEDLIKENASYRYIFNDGLIISSLVNFTNVGGKKNLTTIKRGSLELAGLLAGLFKPLLPESSRLYRFIKLDAEITQTHTIRRSAFAWRVFGGIGLTLPFPVDKGLDSTNLFMPFFRQYFAGGPNSMRAWSVRKLGPGSSVKSFAPSSAPDRFGDIRLEANAEYRYYITQLFGFPMEGALFADMGNVWFRRINLDFPNGEFQFNRLWHDLAIGVGTGFRIDFSFLKARFDFAYKAKDPSPDPVDIAGQNKWFYKWRPGIGDRNGRNGAQFQLGINYPF